MRALLLLSLVALVAAVGNNVTVPFVPVEYSEQKAQAPIPASSSALFGGLMMGGLMFVIIGLFVSISLAMSGPGGGYAAVGADGKSALREYEIRL